MFGGCLAEPGASMDSQSMAGTVVNDVWAYDQAAQGWEEVRFDQVQLGCDLPSEQAYMPAPRAAHGMVSMSTAALVCGGYGFEADGVSKKYLADDTGRIDCAWFTPGSPPRWDKLQASVSSGSSAAAPKPRFGHSMSYDHKVGRVIVFGGQTLKGELLDDCWALSETTKEGRMADVEYMGAYTWASCDPVSQLSLKPQARYGHGSVYFHNSLYVIGGFAQNGLRVSARQDIWVLDLVAAQGNTWREIMPTTKKPEPRGFHAIWLSGFKIILHGGQGPSGVGIAAVLGDTWQFDLFTMEWTQKASSAAVPVMSNMAINPLDNAAKAISFGGRDAYGKPSGRLYTFAVSKTANAWDRVYPAGVRPTRRTGNTIVYDAESARVTTSFGLDGNGMQEDTWILDLTTSMWTCWYGSDPSCQHQAPIAKYRGPGKIAFPSQVQVGMYSFLFGGAKITIQSCKELGRGTTGNVGVASNALGMWAMDVSNKAFVRVQLASQGQPQTTFLSSMVAVSEFPGYKQPLVLAGGADMSCARSTPPCKVSISDRRPLTHPFRPHVDHIPLILTAHLTLLIPGADAEQRSLGHGHCAARECGNER